MNKTSVILLALMSAGAGQLASAQDVGQHPAVFAPRNLPGIDPNTFVVGHPASPHNRAGHANFDHPAVTAWAARRQGMVIDTNAYLVQPPAAVRWTLAPAADVVLASVAALSSN